MSVKLSTLEYENNGLKAELQELESSINSPDSLNENLKEKILKIEEENAELKQSILKLEKDLESSLNPSLILKLIVLIQHFLLQFLIFSPLNSRLKNLDC